jgi:hypothetical protein
MSKVKSLLAAAVALTTATAAVNAAPFTQTVGNVTMTVTTIGTPTNSFGETVTGYTAYDVSVATTDGSHITALSFSGTGLTGFTGPLLQEWDYVTKKGNTTYTPTPDIAPAAGMNNGGGLNGEDYALDSHFLFNLANYLVLASPAEDNPAKTGSTTPGTPGDDGSDVWGIGTNLSSNVAGNVAVTPDPTSVDAAYLVIPNSGIVNYNFAIVSDKNGGTQANFLGTIPGAATPEPASLGVLAIGGAALLARRKKTV